VTGDNMDDLFDAYVKAEEEGSGRWRSEWRERIERKAVADYLASPEAEKALAEALRQTRFKRTGLVYLEPIARAILAAWREAMK
jgi:hypothetical protein